MKLFKLITIFSLNFLPLFCSFIPQSNSVISPKQKNDIEQLFKEVLLLEGGIFTLCGSKPMTMVPIFKYDQKEFEQYYATLSADEKKKMFRIDKHNIAEGWEKWKEFRKKLSFKKFIFEELTDEQAGVTSIYLIDIVKTSLVIQENYQIFREQIGEDFHPLQLVVEFSNPLIQKKYWNKIRTNSLLMGLLLGYGKTNAYSFNWKYFDHPAECNPFCKNLPFTFSRKTYEGIVKYSIEDFDIPMFASFVTPDETIEKYLKEKEQIQNLYRGKDFLDYSLELLQQ